MCSWFLAPFYLKSQLRIDRGHVLGHNMSSGSTSILGGIPIHGGMSTLLRSNLITSSGSKSSQASTADFSGVGVGIGPQNCDSSTKALANLTSQSVTFPIHVEGSNQKILVSTKNTIAMVSQAQFFLVLEILLVSQPSKLLLLFFLFF